MRKGAIFETYEPLVAAAIVGAYANCSGDGFRQRDVRFLIELFSNWVSFQIGGPVLELSNAQVSRYLAELVSGGEAKRSKHAKQPLYKLTRHGLLELVTRLATVPRAIEPFSFLFRHFFLFTYRQRLEELIQGEGEKFPTSLKLELEILLDTKRLLATEISKLELEIRKVSQKIDDAEATCALAEKLAEQKHSIVEIAEEVEKQFPYNLNSQKSMSNLFRSLPDDLAAYELRYGGRARKQSLWSPAMTMLESYLRVLKDLQSV